VLLEKGQSSVGVIAVDENRPGIPWPDRCLDLVIVIVFLPALAVVAGAIALAIYLDSPGSVIFRQRRIGLRGEPFEMLKFRKMCREAHSHPLTNEDDERFTPIGRFLAATRLDELPQVINILRGEMRLVGPRPELECFVAEFAPEYSEILTVAPGLTGNAQLRFAGESALLSGPDPQTTYIDHVMPDKVAIDLAYVRNHSVGSDVLILVRTVTLPFELAIARLHRRPATISEVLPGAACALVLVLACALVFSHLP
jgi:lipopolysaccharide/colanic/teichoic acid biosynthesis glycosyltransferase